MLKAHSTPTTALRAIDLCCIGLGYLVAGEIAVRLSSRELFVFPQQKSSWAAQYSALFLSALLAWVAATAYSGTYHSHRTESLGFVVRTMMRTFFLWALMTAAGISLFKLANVSRQFTAYFLIASSTLMLVRQLATIVFLRRLRRFGYNWRTAVILGAQASCEQFAELLTATYPMGYRVLVRPLSSDLETQRDVAAPLSPQVDDIFIVGTDYAASNKHTGPEAVAGLLKQGKAVHIIPGLLDATLFRQSFSDVAGIPVISLMKGQLDILQSTAKRLADIVVSGGLLILFSPLFALIAILIKLTSSGSVLFKQRRLGLNHKSFEIYKFRTMAANAEEMLKSSPVLYAEYMANNFKLPKNRDPRITRLGSLLRATSLDELPQLLNVLRGDMSLVGPRPIVPKEVEKYGDAAGLFLSAKPGMTGHWQVSGRSDLLGYDKRVELDLEYIRDQSLGKDFEILLRTVPAVLRGKGAH
jgi:exopolysaccharide production protein ExoY